MQERIDPTNILDSTLTNKDFKPLPGDRELIDLDSRLNPNKVLRKKFLTHELMGKFREYQRYFYKTLSERNKSDLQRNIILAPEQLYKRAGQLVAEYLGFWPLEVVSLEGARKSINTVNEDIAKLVEEIKDLEKPEKIRRVKGWLEIQYGKTIDWRSKSLQILLEEKRDFRPTTVPSQGTLRKILKTIDLTLGDLKEEPDSELEKLANLRKYYEFTNFLIEIKDLEKPEKIRRVKEWLDLQYGYKIDWKRKTLASLLNNADLAIPLLVPAYASMDERLELIEVLPIDLQNDFSAFTIKITALSKDIKIKLIKEWISSEVPEIDWNKFGDAEYWTGVYAQNPEILPDKRFLNTKLNTLGLSYNDFGGESRNRDSSFDQKMQSEIEKICTDESEIEKQIIQIRELINSYFLELQMPPIKWSQFTTRQWNVLYTQSNRVLPTQKILRKILGKFDIEVLDLYLYPDRNLRSERKLARFIDTLNSKNREPILKDSNRQNNELQNKIIWTRKYFENIYLRTTRKKINWLTISSAQWDLMAKETNYQIPKYEHLMKYFTSKKTGFTFRDLWFNLEDLLAHFATLPLDQKKQRVAKILGSICGQSIYGMKADDWEKLQQQSTARVYSYGVMAAMLSRIDLNFGEIAESYRSKKFSKMIQDAEIEQSWSKDRKVRTIRNIIQSFTDIEICWAELTKSQYDAINSEYLPKGNYLRESVLKRVGLSWKDLTSPNILDLQKENAVGDYINFIYECFQERTVDLLEPIILAVRQIAKIKNIDNLISDEAIVLFIQQYFGDNDISEENQTGLSTQLIAFLKQNKTHVVEPKTSSVEEVRQFLNRVAVDQTGEDRSLSAPKIDFDKISRFDRLLEIQTDADQSDLSGESLAQYLLFDILSQICNTTFVFKNYENSITQLFIEIDDYYLQNPSSEISKILIRKIDNITGNTENGLAYLNKFIIDYQNDALVVNLAEKVVDQKKITTEAEILDPTVKQLLVALFMTKGSHLQTDITGLKYPYFFDFSECGTGKTFTMISQIIAAPETLHFLLVPNPNLHGITDQVNKYTNDADIEIINIRNLNADKILEIQKSVKENSKKKYVIITTYHYVSNLENNEAEQIANLSSQIPFRVMCDESHNIKTQGSKRWQNLNYILKREQCMGWYNATATPVTVDAEDLIRQIEISSGLDINSQVNPAGSKVSQVDQMLWLRRFLIENNATLSQHELPAKLDIPKIEHQKPQIIIDLQTKKGQKALIKLNRLFGGGGLFEGSRTEISKILTTLKLNPKEFDLEYEGRGESLGDIVHKAKKEGRKMVIYTHSIAHGDIIQEISQALLKLKDSEGQDLLKDDEITYFTAQNDDTDRFTSLERFIAETGFQILISTRVIGASIDGLQGTEGVENSAVKLVWVPNGTSTHASQHQLEGRFIRVGGEEIKDEEESIIKFITPQVVFRNGEKELSLERLLEIVRDYRGGLLKVLFDGSLNQVLSTPDEDSLIKLFVNDLFEMVSDQQLKQILELDSATSNPLSQFKHKADQEFIQTQHHCFALEHDLAQQAISLDDWIRYHKIRERMGESWITLPFVTIRNILMGKLKKSPKENNPVNILELGCGTTPVLGGLRVKQKAELKPITYTNVDIHRGFEPEPSKEKIQYTLLQKVQQLKLLILRANTPREKSNFQKDIISLEADLAALPYMDFTIDFAAGDYRYGESLPDNNDYIISCLSLYTWEEELLRDLLFKLTEKLKTGGEIVFIFTKSDLEKVNPVTNLTRAEMLKSILESLGMVSSKFFEEQRYNFNNLDSFKLLPGSTFVGVSFIK